MKRYFKSKKRLKISNIFKIIFIVFLIVALFNFMIRKINLNDYFNNGINFKINKEKIFYKLALNYNYVEEKTENVFNEIQDNIVKKKIYIYNTHQSEEYKDYNVLGAANKIKEVMAEYNIDVDVEDRSVSKLLKENNYNYNQSYRITRDFLLEKLKDDYDLYIDLHRDSSNKNTTTTLIGDKPYARVMFVIGKKHITYHDNYNNSSIINNNLKNINSNLSRGIFTRENSSFNQDLASNVILIELGGVENSEEEINNTIYELCNAIRYYLDE